jgi:3-oxoacyl-[acyl-carrier-protein] synthase-1
MTKAVHIVGVAARTPVGLSALGTAAALRAGVSRLGSHPFIIDPSGNPLRCGFDRELPKKLIGPARIEALAAAALEELFERLETRDPVPVLLALPEPRPGFSHADAGGVVRALNARSYAAQVSVRATHTGHAGALRALGEAVAAIRSGARALCAVGGAESYLDADAVEWLDGQLMLAHEQVRGGFPPGESAAFVLLASDAARRDLRLPSLAVIAGVDHVDEPRKRDADEGFLGEALGLAIERATASLKLPEEQITDVYCDINGERLRTDDWGFALLRAQNVFREAGAYNSSIAEIGDIGAAWGALNAVLAVEAFRGGYAEGSRALLWGSSWSGARVACVLERGVSK